MERFTHKLRQTSLVGGTRGGCAGFLAGMIKVVASHADKKVGVPKRGESQTMRCRGCLIFRVIVLGWMRHDRICRGN